MIAAIHKSPHKNLARQARLSSFNSETSFLHFYPTRDPFSILKWAQNDLGVTF